MNGLSNQRARDPRRRILQRNALALTACTCLTALLLLSACAPAVSDDTDQEDRGAGMAGPVIDVEVTQAALDDTPPAPVLTSPEAAVRSYLEWTAYAYRSAQSQSARPTMTTDQEIRVDSYLQYNLQQNRLLDQRLVAVTFGTPVVVGDRTLVPAKESWRYRYVSATDAGAVIGGPYEASYDATYTLVATAQGDWLVEEVEATTQDTLR